LRNAQRCSAFQKINTVSDYVEEEELQGGPLPSFHPANEGIKAAVTFA
jgi:hypothetical protein